MRGIRDTHPAIPSGKAGGADLCALPALSRTLVAPAEEAPPSVKASARIADVGARVAAQNVGASPIHVSIPRSAGVRRYHPSGERAQAAAEVITATTSATSATATVAYAKRGAPAADSAWSRCCRSLTPAPSNASFSSGASLASCRSQASSPVRAYLRCRDRAVRPQARKGTRSERPAQLEMVARSRVVSRSIVIDPAAAALCGRRTERVSSSAS